MPEPRGQTALAAEFFWALGDGGRPLTGGMAVSIPTESWGRMAGSLGRPAEPSSEKKAVSEVCLHGGQSLGGVASRPSEKAPHPGGGKKKTPRSAGHSPHGADALWKNGGPVVHHHVATGPPQGAHHSHGKYV